MENISPAVNPPVLLFNSERERVDFMLKCQPKKRRTVILSDDLIEVVIQSPAFQKV